MIGDRAIRGETESLASALLVEADDAAGAGINKGSRSEEVACA